jgi:hypothetical protein
MGLPETLIQPSKVTFHGIVPGRKAYSLGRVVLDVAFGTEENFRREKICFELVNFKSPYHCILGRPAFAKFMARPCYTYNRMKIPGPKGVINVIGDYETAIQCEDGSADQAECVIAQEELDKMTLSIDPLDDTLLKRPTRETGTSASFESAKDTMNIDLVPGSAKEQAVIGKGLESA